MNNSYRSIWNAALSSWVAVPETARARVGATSSKGGVFAAGRLTVLALAMLAAWASPAAMAASVSWDPNGAAVGSGGNGTWDTTSVQWFNGTTFGAWNNGNLDDAVFNAPVAPGAGNTVTLNGGITAHNLSFNSSYTLTGGTLTLGGANPTFTTATGDGTIASVLAGTAGLIKNGAGALTLSGVNTYTGITQLQQGSLTLNSAQALGLAGPAASNFLVSGGTSISFGTNINNSFTALGGVITVGGGNGAIWSGSPTLATSTTLSLSTGSGNYTLTGNLVDTGVNVLSVTTPGVSAGGTVTLSGDNTYTGPTDILGNGVIALGSVGAISPNSNLRFNVAPGGSGGIALTGASGNFTRSLGTGPNQVQWLASGGFYASGTGVTRIVNIGGAGAPLTWGVTPSFVAAADQLVLGSMGGTLDFQNPLVVPTPGTTYQIDAIGGTLAAHARISGVVSGAGDLAVGGSRSAVPANLLELSNVNNIYSGSLILNGIGGGGNVMVSAPGALSPVGGLNFAGPVNSTGDTLVLTPGSGDFTRVTGTGTNQVQWTGNGGFSAAGGNRLVNIGGGALTWGAGNFVPTGSWLNLAASGAGDSEINFRNSIDLDGAARTVNVGTGGTARLSGVLSGVDGGITYQGGGVVTPSATNTYTGVTTIGGGTTVNVSTIGNGRVAGNLGAASNDAASLVLGGGRLNYVGAGETSDRSLTLTGGTTSTINNNSATGALSLAGVTGGGAQLLLGGTSPAERIDPLTGVVSDLVNQLTGVVSGGTTNLIKQGANTWRLDNAANTYVGVTQILDGVLEVSSLVNGGMASSIGASSNLTTNLHLGGSDATLRYTGTGDRTDRAFSLRGNNVIESSGTGALVWNPVAAPDTSAISIATLTLGGTNPDDNVFGGAINNNAASSQGNGWNVGVIKAGPGAWTLTGDQGYTGNTRINGGVLYAGGTNAITGGMGLTSTAPGVTRYTSTTPMSSLIQLDGGVLGLTRASGDFSRALTDASRSFEDNGNNRGLTPNLADDTFIHGIQWTGSGGFAADGVDRSVNLGGAGAGVVWGEGNFVPTGSTLILGASSADSTVTFVNPIAMGSRDRTVQADNGTAVVDGVLSGALTGTGGLIKTGEGTAALTATNTYSGATTVREGTLQLGNGGATGTLGTANVRVDAGATVAFNRDNTYSVANTISGPGTLAQVGTGTTTLTGPTDSVGSTAVTGGTLDVDAILLSDNLLMGNGRLNVDGSFQRNTGAQVTIGHVAGTASTLQVNAGGTMRVNGDLGDGNDTVLAHGTLAVGAAALSLGDGNDAMTISGVLSGSGNTSLGNGDDTLTLTNTANISGYTGVFDGGAQGTADRLVLDVITPRSLSGTQVTNFENLVKSNTGVATLTGKHSYSGGTTITDGTLDVNETLNTATVAMTGDGTTFNVNDKALAEGATPGTPMVITGSAGMNTVHVGDKATLRASGDLGGGNDELDVVGTLDIGGGTFKLGAGDDTFRVHDTTTVVGNIDAGAGNDMLDVTVGITNIVPLGGLQGFESLGKSGEGTLQINGPSAFLTVAVNGGTLDVTSTGSVEVRQTTISTGATLLVNGSYSGTTGNDAMTVAGTVSGAGPINLGAGDDVLTVNDGAKFNNTVDGGAHINGDTVALNNANALTFDGKRTVNFEKLQKSNAGTATLTDIQSYSGGTTITGGTLEVTGTLNTPTVAMTADDTTFSLSGPATGRIAGTSTVISGSAGKNTVRVGAGLALRATGDLGGGNDVLDVAGTLDTGTGTFNLGAGDDTFILHDDTKVIGKIDAGAGNDMLNVDVGHPNIVELDELYGFESLGKSGTGTLEINGPSKFITVDVEGGILHVTSKTGQTPGSVEAQQTTVGAGAVLLVEGSYSGTTGNDTMTVAGFVNGTGPINLGAGDDVLTVNDGAVFNNTVDGGAHINGDTVALDNAKALTFDGTRAVNFEKLQKSNSGIATITGTQNYSGGTTITGGTLDVDGTLNTPTVTMTADDTTLNVDGTVQAAGATPRTSTVITGNAGKNTVRVGAGATLHATGDLGGGNDVLDVAGTLEIRGGAFNLGAGDDSFIVGDSTRVVGDIGPFQYEMHVVSGQENADGWYLRSKDNRPPILPGDPPIGPEVAAASPEVSLNNTLGAMTQLYGMQSLGTWQNRHGNADSGLARNGTHTWARTFGATGNIAGGGLQSRGADFGFNSMGVQAGADVQLAQNGSVEDRVGGYAGAGNIHSSVRHFDRTDAGTSAMRAYSVGGYWTRTSQEGWYVDAVAQYTRYDKVRTASVQGIHGETSGWGVAASLEAGKSFKLSDSLSVEPQAQLIVQRTHLNDVRDSNLTDISLGNGNSVLGRVGGRMVHKWFDAGSTEALGSAWLRVNAWQEFSGKTSNTYRTTTGPLAYGSDMRGNWGEVELGFSSAISSRTSIFGSLAYQQSLSGMGREGASFSTGVNAGGAAVMGMGLSTQLTPNARLNTRASYGNSANGQKVTTAGVELDLKW